MTRFQHLGWVVSLALSGNAAWGADDAGVVKISRGTVAIERGGQKLDAPVGTRIFASDRISTGQDGSIGITLRDNTMLSAGPNSSVDLNKFAFDTTTHAGTINASVKRGTLSVISGKIAKATPEGVSFSAPGMTLGVRGTSFLIDAGE
jgi:hypothetical protein